MIAAISSNIFLQVILMGVSALTTYGIAFFLVRHLTVNKHIFLLSLILLPPVVVLWFSGFSYVAAAQVSFNSSTWFFVCGAFLTLVALICSRKNNSLLGESFLYWPLLFGLTGMVSHDLFNATNAFSYNYLGNGEYLNYAKLATFLTEDITNPSGFFAAHRQMRYGQDIWLGYVVNILNKHPIEVIHLCGGYLRFAYGVAIGIVASSILREKKSLFLVLVLYVISVVELFSFNASFSSSNLYVPYAILWVVALLQFARYQQMDGSAKNFQSDFKNDIYSLVILLAFSVFGALTYPEFNGAMVLFFTGYMVFGVVTRKYPIYEYWRFAFGLLAPLVFLFVFNRQIITNEAKVFIGQATSGGGWNIFSDPKTSLVEYLSFIFGLKFRLGTSIASLPAGISSVVVVLAALVFLYGASVLLLKRDRFSYIFALWIIAIVTSNVIAFIFGPNFYAATKLILQTNFIIMITMGAALLEPQGAPRLMQSGAIRKMIFVLGWTYALFASYMFGISVDHSRQQFRSYNLSEWKEILKSNYDPTGEYAVVGDKEKEGIWFLELATISSGVKLMPLSDSQIARLERRAVPLPCEGSTTRSINYDYLNANSYVVLQRPGRDGFIYLEDGSGAYFESAFFGRRIGESAQNVFFRRDNAGRVRYLWLDTEWMIDGAWSACVTVPRNTMGLEFNVPGELFIGQSAVQFVLEANGRQLNELTVDRPGRYRIGGEVQDRDSVVKVILKSSASWVPRNVNAHSADSRKLGASILSFDLQ